MDRINRGLEALCLRPPLWRVQTQYRPCPLTLDRARRGGTALTQARHPARARRNLGRPAAHHLYCTPRLLRHLSDPSRLVSARPTSVGYGHQSAAVGGTTAGFIRDSRDPPTP